MAHVARHGTARPCLGSWAVISREAWDLGRQTPVSPNSKHGLLEPTAADPLAWGQEVSSWTSQGKWALVPPATGEAAGHGSRQAAVTKLCQAQRSPEGAVTQRHTSGSLSFPQHGGGLAAAPMLSGGWHLGFCTPRSLTLQGWDAGQPAWEVPPLGMPQGELGAATDEEAPNQEQGDNRNGVCPGQETERQAFDGVWQKNRPNAAPVLWCSGRCPARTVWLQTQGISGMSHFNPLILTVKWKKKKNSPKAVFWKLRFYFPDEAGQSRDLPSCCRGKRKPGENAGAVGSRGLCATSALPSNITRHNSYSTWEHLWEWQELCWLCIWCKTASFRIWGMIQGPVLSFISLHARCLDLKSPKGYKCDLQVCWKVCTKKRQMYRNPKLTNAVKLSWHF